MSQDFNKRIIVVVRKDLEAWQIANTIAHISAYIGNRLKDEFDTGAHFVSRDGVEYPRNAQYPIIIKRARSSEQLTNLMEKIRTTDIMYHGFIREMIDHTNDTDLQGALDVKDAKDIEYLGIGVFGDNEVVNKLTKKFGLWK